METGFSKLFLRQFIPVVSLMQHIVALLPLMQRNGSSINCLWQPASEPHRVMICDRQASALERLALAQGRPVTHLLKRGVTTERSAVGC